MRQLTVGWARAENAADMPHDSGVVFPEKRLSVGWKPMLSSSVLDWDDADLRVTPGAGPDREPEPGPAPTPEPGPAPAPESPKPGVKLLPPDVTVAARRTMSLFRQNGLIVDIRTPADAEVRAVLMASVTQRKGNRLIGPVRRKLTRTKAASTKANKRVRIVLPISNDGRRAIKDYDRLKATLQVVTTYRGGTKLSSEKAVLLVDRPVTAKAEKRSKKGKK